MLGLHCRAGFSLVAPSGGCPLVVCCCGHGLGTLGRQHLWLTGSVVSAPRLWSTGSLVVTHGLSCSIAYGIFPDQGSNLCLLHWQADSLPLSHQGSPLQRPFWGSEREQKEWGQFNTETPLRVVSCPWPLPLVTGGAGIPSQVK